MIIMLKCDSFRKKAMDDLVHYIGELTQVEYVEEGIPLLFTGEMDHVLQFDSIILQDFKIVNNNNEIAVDPFPFQIPFIGEGIAIQKINIKDEGFSKTLYDNFFIRNDYNLTDPNKILELKDLIFGNLKSG